MEREGKGPERKLYGGSSGQDHLQHPPDDERRAEAARRRINGGAQLREMKMGRSWAVLVSPPGNVQVFFPSFFVDFSFLFFLFPFLGK